MSLGKKLTPKEIQEIRSLRGKMSQAEIRKKFGIGTGRLYKLWNSDEENSGQAASTPGASEPTDSAVMRALGRIEKKIGRLLKAQEGHYENVEELEGTVEQIAEAGTNILDGLEEGSRQVRTTAENCPAKKEYRTWIRSISIMQTLLLLDRQVQ